jgi:HAD superfamily hydrolase (TIGR01549 family)
LTEGPPQRRTSPPLAVTIDLWYTLIAFSRAGPTKYERARRAAWVDPLVARSVPRRTAEKAVRAMEAWASEREATGRSVSLAEQADEMARLTGVRPEPDRVGHAIAFALASANLRWSPGLRPALQRLRRRGLRLGVVSNILYEPPEAAHALLRRLGEGKLFDAVVLSSDGVDAKPAPRILGRAAGALGVAPSDLLHVGDSTADLLAARRAGVAFVRFTGRPNLRGAWRPAPTPNSRYPSVRTWSALASDLDEIWKAAAAARDRSVRPGRTEPGRRRPRVGARASASSSGPPTAPRGPPTGSSGAPQPRG